MLVVLALPFRDLAFQQRWSNETYVNRRMHGVRNTQTICSESLAAVLLVEVLDLAGSRVFVPTR